MEKKAKVNISETKYRDLYIDKPLEIEVGKKYKRRIIGEKRDVIEKEYFISEILELDDGGLIIKSNTV